MAMGRGSKINSLISETDRGTALFPKFGLFWIFDDFCILE
jgi:hypothetical protein